mgnify:CR=1 FL=1
MIPIFVRLVQGINSSLSAFHASLPSFFGDRLGWHPSGRFHFGLLPRFVERDFPPSDLPWPCLRWFAPRLFGQTWNLLFVKGLFAPDFVGFAAVSTLGVVTFFVFGAAFFTSFGTVIMQFSI